MNTKRVTKAGAVSIPVGIRREMNIRAGDALDVEADGSSGSIIVRPHLPRCVFCGGTQDVALYMGKGICRLCAGNAGKEQEDGKQEDAGREGD